MKQGALITFEGGDGAGKTSLLHRLKKEFDKNGVATLITREPGGTPLGENIRNLLLHQQRSLSPVTELLLFLAARKEHIQTVILPAINQNLTILCDRFNDSSIAYQGGARGLGREWTQNLCEMITEEVKPDFTIYLDINPKLGRERRSSTPDRMEQEALSFHEKVQLAYLELIQQFPERIHRIDASLPAEEVFAQAKKELFCRGYIRDI